jgi:choline dehydrogenase-like flavoprotein
LPREPENWSSRDVFVRGRYVSRETWIDKNGESFSPHAQYYVGGNTKVYGAILFRLRERDFGEVAHYGGISPSWPCPTRISSLTTPRQSVSIWCTVPPERTTPNRLALAHSRTHRSHTSHASSSSPISSSERTFILHLPVGIDLDESRPELGRCVRCDRFDGFPCLADGKSDAHVRCVRPALEEHPNLTLLTHARAERLETDASRRTVTKVVVERLGAREESEADLVISSCGAINSAALLLRSAEERHPHGLGNSSRQLGCNYMAHINSAVIAISPRSNPTTFQKTLGINDYYWGAPDSELPLGHIQMLAKSDGQILKAGSSSAVRPAVRSPHASSRETERRP